MKETNLSLNQQKATVYRLLSACYYQPEPAFHEENVFGQLTDALCHIDSHLAETAKTMDTEFKETAQDELLLDYSRLFLGPFDIFAKPYGSVYIDGEKVVMGDSTINALASYSEADFAVAEDFREMPDHVAVELEFLYLLTCRQNDALAHKESEQLRFWSDIKTNFLKNHLGSWVSRFCQNIREHSETNFYYNLAELTEQYILQENR